MARPRSDRKKVALSISVDADLRDRIDAHRNRSGLGSRSEATQDLVENGLRKTDFETRLDVLERRQSEALHEAVSAVRRETRKLSEEQAQLDRVLADRMDGLSGDMASTKRAVDRTRDSLAKFYQWASNALGMEAQKRAFDEAAKSRGKPPISGAQK